MPAERQLNGSNLLLYRGTASNGITVEVTNDGAGYDSAPAISFTGGGGSGAAATAVMTGSAGSLTVASITITNPGTGYTAVPTVVFTGGTPSTPAAATASLAENFELVACLTNNDISQSKSDVSTETKCGKVTLPGTKDASVTFSYIPNLSPAAGKVAMETLQDDFNNDVESNWKATTAGAATGDPLFEFTGFIKELGYKAAVNTPFSSDGTIQVDENGISLEMIA